MQRGVQSEPSGEQQRLLQEEKRQRESQRERQVLEEEEVEDIDIEQSKEVLQRSRKNGFSDDFLSQEFGEGESGGDVEDEDSGFDPDDIFNLDLIEVVSRRDREGRDPQRSDRKSAEAAESTSFDFSSEQEQENEEDDGDIEKEEGQEENSGVLGSQADSDSNLMSADGNESYPVEQGEEEEGGGGGEEGEASLASFEGGLDDILYNPFQPVFAVRTSFSDISEGEITMDTDVGNFFIPPSYYDQFYGGYGGMFGSDAESTYSATSTSTSTSSQTALPSESNFVNDTFTGIPAPSLSDATSTDSNEDKRRASSPPASPPASPPSSPPASPPRLPKAGRPLFDDDSMTGDFFI